MVCFYPVLVALAINSWSHVRYYDDVGCYARIYSDCGSTKIQIDYWIGDWEVSYVVARELRVVKSDGLDRFSGVCLASLACNWERCCRKRNVWQDLVIKPVLVCFTRYIELVHCGTEPNDWSWVSELQLVIAIWPWSILQIKRNYRLGSVTPPATKYCLIVATSCWVWYCVRFGILSSYVDWIISRGVRAGVV